MRTNMTKSAAESGASGAVVCKFGGTSMADECSVRRVEGIVRKNPARRFIVVSAPGKTPCGRKVTDVLIDCHREISETGRCDKSFPEVVERFRGLYCGMSELGFLQLMAETKREMERDGGYDFCVSRGEYLSARFFAERIGFPFIDSAELIRFGADGYDEAQTERVCRARMKSETCGVIPGFYGADERGRIVAFSRGGSDITGSILARAVRAVLYENWTDVDGILDADPRIVPDAKIIERMTYNELRELAYLGAAVMHPDALLPLVKGKIPLNVRNTFRPELPGTLICSVLGASDKRVVTGIAGKTEFRVLFIHKIGLNAQKSVVRKILSVLERHGVLFEHMPSSLDAVNILIPNACLSPERAERITEEIKESVKPDDVRILDNLAIVSIVGRNMFQAVGVAAKMLTALAERKINIRMLIQGCREINVIVGIQENRYREAVNALYDAFLREKKS